MLSVTKPVLRQAFLSISQPARFHRPKHNITAFCAKSDIRITFKQTQKILLLSTCRINSLDISTKEQVF